MDRCTHISARCLGSRRKLQTVRLHTPALADIRIRSPPDFDIPADDLYPVGIRIVGAQHVDVRAGRQHRAFIKRIVIAVQLHIVGVGVRRHQQQTGHGRAGVRRKLRRRNLHIGIPIDVQRTIHQENRHAIAD